MPVATIPWRGRLRARSARARPRSDRASPASRARSAPWIAYATQPDAVALDGEGRNSPFTTALIKHIATPGQDIGVIMRRVRTDVVQVTRGKQVPWDHSLLMGEVVLAR